MIVSAEIETQDIETLEVELPDHIWDLFCDLALDMAERDELEKEETGGEAAE